MSMIFHFSANPACGRQKAATANLATRRRDHFSFFISKHNVQVGPLSSRFEFDEDNLDLSVLQAS